MEKPLSIQLNCPLPQLDFEVITLGHGSGGLLTQKLLDSGVFDLLKNPLLEQREDGAVFEIPGKMAMSTDSYVVTPLFFPGGNIGDLAINGTVNDLAMCGAKARYLSLSFIIEEGLPMTEFWEVLLAIREAAAATGVQIVTGDTKVVERGKGDKIFINTTGVGEVHSKASLGAGRIQPGDKIILSGYLARHGIAIMSKRQGLDFGTQIESDTRPLGRVVEQLLSEFGPHIKLLRDPTRGGVATVLNELAQQCKLGMEVFEQQLPLEEQVASACEMLGLDPLYIANEGLFISIVSSEQAEAVVQALQAQPEGQGAAIIGEVTEAHPSRVIFHSRIGGRRNLNMLTGEQLPRIC